MARIANFEGNFRKFAGHSNQFKAPKSMIKEKDRTFEWQQNIIDWNTYYRRNIHRFIQHYFQVNLYWYQIIWIYHMSISEKFITIASRASSKSWLIALLALARGVLYPNSEIVVVATTQKQASIILGKINGFKKDYPNIAREIDVYRNVSAERICTLHNNTTIKVVSCNEDGRGERSTFTIAEEFRLMDKEKYDSVVKPFAYARQTPYIKKPEYQHLIEEPREIMIGSAYHKSLWWYTETMQTIKAMVEGRSVGFIAFDYLIAIKHGIKTRKLIARDKEDMDAITFMEEYENIPFGEYGDAYFKFDMFENKRKIKKCFYPLREDIVGKNPYFIKRVGGEIRIISVDVNARKGNKNDNTIITCIRGIPTKTGYMREFCYMESLQGEHTGKQALRIKQIYYDFNADYIVLDLRNVGIAVFERLAAITKDDVRGVEHEAFTVYEHRSLTDSLIKELREKTLSAKAKPVIYPILATAELNSNIAVDFRDNLTRETISFLINENDAEDYLLKTNKEYARTKDVSLKAWFIHPYMQISEFIVETVGLKTDIVGGNIRLEERGSAKKDRYTSSSYGNYFISLLEKDLLKETKEDIRDYFIKPVSTPWSKYSVI